MGKHKLLSLGTHKYKTTFTLTTKIVIRFSSCFIFSSSSTMPTMTPSALHGTYDTLISLHDKLTRLNGVITPEADDKLEDELGGIFTVTKIHHYEQGQKYGHLASAIPKSKYKLVIGSPTWNHTVPTDPGAYSTNALAAGNAAAMREQFVAQPKIEQKSYRDYPSVEEAGKELILYAVGNNVVAPLKKQYIGFGDTTVLQMIDRLHLKTAIRMTTAKKFEYKTNGYNTPWDPTTSITTYFTQLNRFQVSLGDRGIATSDQEKTMAAGAQMWHSEMLTEDQMVDGKIGRRRRRRGRSSRHTSQKSGWNESSILPPRQSNRVSRKQHSKLKRLQQLKRKVRCRQCYS